MNMFLNFIIEKKIKLINFTTKIVPLYEKINPKILEKNTLIPLHQLVTEQNGQKFGQNTLNLL